MSNTQKTKHLEALRAELKRRNLFGFIVPHTDEYGCEFLPPRAERLAWISGFKGSFGTAMILMDSALIWTDGRYQLQVREEVDGDSFEFAHIDENPPEKWITGIVTDTGARIGYDPLLHTTDQVKKLSDA